MPTLVIASRSDDASVVVQQGMGLQHEESRKLFSVFQFELGGHWAISDPRHAKGTMSQNEVLGFLINRGYDVYLTGEKLLRIGPEFFNTATNVDDGDGPFVQGNALAVHPEYADPLVLGLVSEFADANGWAPRKS